MKNPLSVQNLQDNILEIRGVRVLLDSDIARIYGVETRDVNKAVANNPDKFPEGFIFVLTKQEKAELVESFHRFAKLKHSTALPKAFPEKGLYMLATILRSKQATAATFAIIEAFAKIRELSMAIRTLATGPDETRQKSLMQRSGEIVSDLFDEDLKTNDTETSIELNFAVLKFKHTVKRKNKRNT